MAKINVKTKGNADPQGKPRVWFCAHPEDHVRYFEGVSNEILALQDCAVYFDEEPFAPHGADFLSDLAQMNLFVLPVTTKLLTTANRALDVELPYAVANHIPILPLMQEQGLEELFNKKCGERQFLDKNARDNTALSYKEKLERYLSAVLVGDALAEKVRGAFDAYIFLSYRKKDRRYAREMMRLIHGNEFCRDIAIWYDEFLVPGENFNAAIRQALEKSELFALAVTPNLLSENNYVMKVEYPAARDLKKGILPVELLPTDTAQLKEKFADIPTPTNAGDAEGLTAALAELLRGVAIRENGNDPQHNFFIGLAYLSGIDVEVDYDRGIRLVQSAAEADLPEAVEKMVMLCREAQRYRDAVVWQGRLVELKKRAFEEHGDRESARAYLRAVWNQGEQLYGMRDLKGAQEAFGRLSELIGKAGNLFGEGWDTNNLATIYTYLGMIAEETCIPEEPKMYFSRAAGLLERTAREGKTFAVRHNLLVNYQKIGDVAKAQTDWQTAKEYYEKALRISEASISASDTSLPGRDCMVSYGRLGDVARAREKWSEASAYYKKALKIAEELAAREKTVQARLDLSCSYHNLAQIAAAQEIWTLAQEYCEKALATDKRLVEETGSVETRRALLVRYGWLGNIAVEQGKLTQAIDCYERALEIAQGLAEETALAGDCDDCAVSHYKLGAFAKDTLHLQKALEIWEALAQQYPETAAYAARRDIVQKMLEGLQE